MIKERKKVKRACMVAYTFYDIDNRVRRYAETLVKYGWEVDAVVLKNDNGLKKRSIKGVNVIGLKKRTYNEKNKLTYLIRLITFFAHSFHFLMNATLRKPYSLVHVHSIPDFQVFAALIPKLCGAKIILDIHDIVPELFIDKFKAERKGRLFKLLLLVEKISCAFADHVIIANDLWRNRLISRSVRSDKCTTIINYPDPEIFCSHKKERNDNKFLLMYPGTLSKHQGIETAIDAAVKARKHISGIELHIFGKGSDEDYLKEHTHKLQAGNFIRFRGVLDLEDIAVEMAKADIGIEPKLNGPFSGEAFSTKTLEFLLLGVPVIASDTRVHKLYLADDIVMYFPAGDSDALCNAILSAYARKENAELSEKIKIFMKENNWTTRKKIYLQLIQNLLGYKENEKRACIDEKNETCVN